MTKRGYILLGICVISIATSAYLGNSLHQLKKASKEASLAEEDPVETQVPYVFADIDRNIEEGNYKKARKLLNALRSKSVEESAIVFRINMLAQLRSLSKNDDEQVSTKGVISIDSLEKVAIQPLSSNPNKYDSLSAALVSSEIQVKNLQSKLEQSSSGQYLVFETTKGTGLHYVGETKSGKANGYGIAILASGSRYEGEWQNNMRHGRGKFVWEDGEVYEGEYKDDLRSGDGSYFWANEEKYVGKWENDRRNGHGVFYSKKGKIVASGVWKDDKLETKDKKRKK